MKTPNLQLFVHTPNDDIISFNNINQDAKVNELKSQLEIKTGILSDIQNLYLSNVKLEDGKTFLEKNIKNGSVLRVKIKEKSLEQIYLNSIKGDVQSVFSLGVEFMQNDENEADDDNETADAFDQVVTWNKFVPLRAFQALFAACFKGELKLVTELIKRSAAHVQIVSKTGRSCLHVAASHGNLMCVSLLLGQGVNAKLLDGEGVSALEMAANNGHIKCEKRIWLFNWNLDVLKDLDEKRRIKSPNEEEYEKEQLNETAERYEKQYRESKPAKTCSIFPPISTNHDVGNYENYPINKKSHTPTLPHVDITRHRETVQEDRIARMKSSNFSKLVFLKQSREDKVKQQLQRTKSAPQVKETSTVNKWNHRTIDFDSGSNPNKKNYEKTLFHAPEIASPSAASKDQRSSPKGINLEDLNGNNQHKKQRYQNHSPILSNDVSSLDLSQVSTKEEKMPWERSWEYYKDLPELDKQVKYCSRENNVTEISLNNLENYQELSESDQSLYWSMRANNVKEPPPLDKTFVPIATVDSIDFKVSARQRRIIKSDREAVKKSNDKYKTIEIQSRNNSNASNIENRESKDLHKEKATTKIKIQMSPEKIIMQEQNEILTRDINTIVVPEVTLTESTSIKDNDEDDTTEDEKEDTVEKKERNDEMIDKEKEEEGEEKENNNNEEFEKINKEQKNNFMYSSPTRGSETWRPQSSLSFSTTDFMAYYRRTQKSYDEWLSEKKKKKKEEDNSPRENQNGNLTLEERDELNKEAYEKWLAAKSRQRTRSASEPVSKTKKFTKSLLNDSNKNTKLTRSFSAQTLSADENINKKLARTFSEKGLTFEEWLEQKRIKNRPKSASFTRTKQKSREKLKTGMTYEQWLKWKKSQNKKLKDIDFRDHKNNTSNGVSFEKWLHKKEEERRTQQVLDKTKIAQQENERDLQEESRFHDPHQRTFEEWYLEKKYNNKLEKSYNKTKEREIEMKCHPEDASLVFNMWLAEKYLKDMKNEKEKLNDVKRGKKSNKKTLGDISEDNYDYSSDSYSDDSMTSS